MGSARTTESYLKHIKQNYVQVSSARLAISILGTNRCNQRRFWVVKWKMVRLFNIICHNFGEARIAVYVILLASQTLGFSTNSKLRKYQSKRWAFDFPILHKCTTYSKRFFHRNLLGLLPVAHRLVVMMKDTTKVITNGKRISSFFFFFFFEIHKLLMNVKSTTNIFRL